MTIASEAPDVAAHGTQSEPILEVKEIQGNVVGFNKDFQTLLFLRIDEPATFRKWLGKFARRVATAEEVLAFNRLFKETSKRRGYSAVKASWINIAFSYAGIAKLRPDAADEFTDASFRSGAGAESAQWLVRDGDGGADVLIIVASDDLDDLADEVARVEQSIYAQRVGASVVFKQEGRTRTGPLAGHEHFGFRDGISQPGIRGRVSRRPGDFLTPRENPKNSDQGKPGQALVWPGEFIFYERGESSDPVGPDLAPDWAKNGSYLVFQRLKQQVFRFHSFVHGAAVLMNLTPDAAAARFVGRWASGAPIMLAPRRDNPVLAADNSLNNDFEFAGADPNADLCPFSSHIRKAYPRDDAPATTHRLLRRGIPYGSESSSTPAVPVDDDVDRGLLFMAYMTSITDQFESVIDDWVNDPDFKERGTGADAVLGQMTSGSGRRAFEMRVDGLSYPLSATDDWVIPTGGGYFFSPSISALKGDLGVQIP